MSDDINSLLQMLRYWETEPCLPGPAKTCKEARQLIEQQASRIAELEARERTMSRLLCRNGDGLCVMDSGLELRLAAPVASGPRYDWSVSGMKQSETGNWVMAGSAEKTGE